MKNKLYFQHDYNARNDVRLLELRAEFGAEGYGLFWMIIETMFEDNGLINRGAIGGLSLGYSVPKGTLMPVIDFCIELGLFCVDSENSNLIFSDRVNKQLEFRKQLSVKGLEGAKKRWNKNKNGEAIGGANAKDKDKEKVKDIKKNKQKKDFEKISKQKELNNNLLKHDHFKNNEFKEIWSDWKDYRGSKFTVNAQNLQLSDLFRHDVDIGIDAIKKSLSSGYKGIFINEKNVLKKSVMQKSRQAMSEFAEEDQAEHFRDVKLDNKKLLKG